MQGYGPHKDGGQCCHALLCPAVSMASCHGGASDLSAGSGALRPGLEDAPS